MLVIEDCPLRAIFFVQLFWSISATQTQGKRRWSWSARVYDDLVTLDRPPQGEGGWERREEVQVGSAVSHAQTLFAETQLSRGRSGMEAPCPICWTNLFFMTRARSCSWS